jgi:hypothetical protein
MSKESSNVAFNKKQENDPNFSKSRNKKESKGGGKVMWVAATTHKSYQIAAATCKMANGSLHKISSNLHTGGKILLFS